MDCLNGYIGLSSKDEATPESGLYVDSLPDISAFLVGKIADSEKGTMEEVWTDIEMRGIKKFRILFIAEINRCHRINKADVCNCLICENKELLATALWYLLGAEVMLERTSSSRLNRFTTIDLGKAKELRNELMDAFSSELATAVAGIDLIDSACVTTNLEVKNIVTTHLPIL